MSNWFLSEVEKKHADERYRRIAAQVRDEKRRRSNFLVYGQHEKPRPMWKWWLRQIFKRSKEK